ncbi:MAG: DNA primase [Lachnospiraceae bacterium]|nr:DNA primase [Lachnospiraceae bacterium]
MYYSDELVEEIRSRSDIVDVVSGYVKLQKKGANHWGCCPFHNEKTPSFAVNGNKQMYHCFGCGAGGNVYTFIMNYENHTFPEAVKMLADRAGVQIPEPEISEEAKKRESRKTRLLEVNKEAAKFFYYQLRSTRGEIGQQYFKRRMLTEETMGKFGLGYAGKNGAELVQYLRKKGFEDDIIKDAGLASHSEKYGLTSQFWNRVMFPIQDSNHRVIGFGGRVLGNGEPKYLNSPETPVFDKRRNLYGLNFARTSRSGNIILCEGYMDVIAMHQAGFTQAVASLGTAFTPEQANILRRYTDSVLIAYDSDGAGTKAALRAVGILRDAGLSAKVINMSPHKDPDEFMKAEGKEAFEERIRNAENSFFFEIRIMERDYDMKDPEEKTKFHQRIARKLCEFSEDVERDNYLQAVAQKYFIGIENLRKLVMKEAGKIGLAKPVEQPRSLTKNKNTKEDNTKRDQRLLITWITDQPDLYGKIKKYITPKDFTEDLYRTVVERLFADLEQNVFNPAGIISMFEDPKEQEEAASLFSTTLPELETVAEKEKAFRDILLSVKKNSYEYYVTKMGSEMDALTQVVAGKKALEELAKTHISLE